MRLLHEALWHTKCHLHAYVLMDNHVHLLLTPPAPGAIAQLMQKLGRQYVGQFNARHGRTGTLWEGRDKSCLVDSESYVLRCHRYIDLNPIRARITADPYQFRWSSADAHAGHRHDALLTEHPAYLGIGASPAERGTAYRALLGETVSDDEMLAMGSTLLVDWTSMGSA